VAAQLKIPAAAASFEDALYVISIGGNDFMFAYGYYTPQAFVESVVISGVLESITSAIEVYIYTYI
jgi:hypothetical protein